VDSIGMSAIELCKLLREDLNREVFELQRKCGDLLLMLLSISCGQYERNSRRVRFCELVSAHINKIIIMRASIQLTVRYYY
jgi:hypothetical protein